MYTFFLGQATVKRRKKSAQAPNPKKMFEEAQMVRRVKAYLNNLHVVSDETRLHEMSLECEGSTTSGSANGSIGSGSQCSGAQRGRRHASPAPSTTSSASSASDERKPSAGNKFGTASPQAVRKLLALSEPTKTRPHQPRQPPGALALGPPQPSPAVRRAPSATGKIYFVINDMKNIPLIINMFDNFEVMRHKFLNIKFLLQNSFFEVSLQTFTQVISQPTFTTRIATLNFCWRYQSFFP